MTETDMIAALRAKLTNVQPQQNRALKAWGQVTPSWASYFQGYRDALNEVIEMIENPGKIPDITGQENAK